MADIPTQKAVILHGVCDAEEYFEMDFPSSSNAHWLPWLQQKFLRAGVLCQTLEMPTPYAPVYEAWAKTFEQLRTDELEIVVAHSAGCGFILKWLTAHPEVSLKGLILVAPWQDPYRNEGDFLKGDLDPDLMTRVGELHLLFSDDEDVKGVPETKDALLKQYPGIIYHPFTDHGHFCAGDMGTTKFPKLWELCYSFC